MSHIHKHGCGLHCLQVNGLTVTIGSKTIVSGVSLHAHCGELTAVIGRNGAGKSTLMKALIGELPYGGSITFSGHNGNPTPQKPRCGYVPQSLNIDKSSPATVRDMMLCYTSRLPVFLPRRKQTVNAIKDHLAQFGADGLMSRRVGDLSGGELQRVLFSLATWKHPDLILLDEPVSGIDNEGLQTVYTMIDNLCERDMLVLLVSHDLDYVRRHAKRVILLEKGRVAAMGTPEEVFATEAFSAAFPLHAKGEVSG